MEQQLICYISLLHNNTWSMPISSLGEKDGINWSLRNIFSCNCNVRHKTFSLLEKEEDVLTRNKTVWNDFLQNSGMAALYFKYMKIIFLSHSLCKHKQVSVTRRLNAQSFDSVIYKWWNSQNVNNKSRGYQNILHFYFDSNKCHCIVWTFCVYSKHILFFCDIKLHCCAKIKLISELHHCTVV